MKRREPRVGDLYRYFQGDTFKIICLAYCPDNKDRMVVYMKCFPSTKKIYSLKANTASVRSLTTFMAEVDREKYPDAKQKYCFEWVASQPSEI